MTQQVIENLWKGIITTLLGSAMMIFAFYGWYFEEPPDNLTDKEALILGFLGFVVAFLRFKFEEAISKLIVELPGRFMNKWFGSNDKK